MKIISYTIKNSRQALTHLEARITCQHVGECQHVGGRQILDAALDTNWCTRRGRGFYVSLI